MQHASILTGTEALWLIRFISIRKEQAVNSTAANDINKFRNVRNP
jgi:hypothetical protein